MDPKYMNFTNLPFKVQTKIFSYLSPKSCQELRLVRKEWKDLLDMIPNAVVNNDNYKKTIKLTQVLFVRIHSLTTEVQQGVMFKESIQRLEFWDILVSYNFLHFLKECSLVKELIFGNVTLDSQRKLSFPEGLLLALPEIKTITFYLKRHLHFTADELILLDFLKQIKFGKLNQVALHSPFHPKRIGRGHDFDQWANWAEHNALRTEFTNAGVEIKLPAGIKSSGLVSFLIRNSETVKKFLVDSDYFCPFGRPLEEVSAAEMAKLQFENMSGIVREAEGLTANKCLILENQRNLREVNLIIAITCWPVVSLTIGANALSLTKVGITIQQEPMLGNPDTLPHDASTFKDCCNLKTLDWDARVPIVNLSSLPKCIRKLTLVTSTLTKQVILEMIANLANLEEATLCVCLYDYVVEDVPFFDDDFIQALISQISLEKLEHLYLSRCSTDQVSSGPLKLEKFKNDGFEVTFTLAWSEIPVSYGVLSISKLLALIPPAEQQFVIQEST